MVKWWPLVAVCLGTFVLLVDVTILTVALPDMATGLHTSLSGIQWVINVYALALAALLLGLGSLADLLGRRLVYLLGLGVYAAGALVCAFAPNIQVMIAGRGVQGIGAAAMFATIVALLGVTYRGRDRGVAFGVWGAVSSAAVAVGPLLGGLLTQHLGWRWIFAFGLLVSLGTMVLVRLVLAESRDAASPRLDLPGMVSFTVAAGAVTFALIRVHDAGWLSAATLWPVALGLVALVVFVVVERSRPHPMLDLKLFRGASFTGVMVGALLLQGAAFAYLPYLTVGLRSVLHAEPVTTGLVLLPQSIAAFVVSLLAGRFLHSVPPRWSIGPGLLVIGAGALVQAAADFSGGVWVIVPGLVISGIGVGMATPTLASAAVAAVPVQRAGMAGGAVNTFRQLGYALGIAVLGAIFSSSVDGSLSGRPDLVGDPHAATEAVTAGRADQVVGGNSSLDELVRSAFSSGMDVTYLVAGVAALVGGLIVVLLLKERPRTQAGAPVTADSYRA
ncbi:MFS transporter [Saccharothrix variisporea]|uniref:EmrB/QacA subfamily drug resistance transporter n=1 Tax=Saccharothrix variisporea TaxID=543527 RepID=A0A495XNV7_9PSEU|nr:MFS transporter [Saccharothrix variisporea]RKT74576.1 EmrB/QacA subfamily drug resistance transporter [Saccharothrix variisporea]